VKWEHNQLLLLNYEVAVFGDCMHVLSECCNCWQASAVCMGFCRT